VISYHPLKNGRDDQYCRGFNTADTDGVARIARGICSYVWSPCIWRDGNRNEDNFLRADWWALDFDNGEMTLTEACRLFCDMVHIIGTTKSHQIDKGGKTCDRFRLLLKSTEPVTDVRDYRYTLKKLIDRHSSDPKTKDGGRMFYPCKRIVQTSAEGYTEDIVPAPQERPIKNRFAAYRPAVMMPSYARFALTNVIPTGSRNSTWYGVAKDLGRVGLAPDEILARVIASPTYAGKASHDLVAEIAACIRNGLESIQTEVEAEHGR